MGAYLPLTFNTHISFQSCNRHSTIDIRRSPRQHFLKQLYVFKHWLLLQVKIIYESNHVDLPGNSSLLNPAFTNHSLVSSFVLWI